MSLFQQYVATVYALTSAGRWGDMQEYFKLMREVLNSRTASLTPGTITDKEIS